MAARASLSTIITKVRAMVDDAASAVFTDDQLQDALDRRRDEARYVILKQLPTITPDPGAGATTTYLTFDAPVGDWESVELVDSGYNVITPDTADLDAGRWTFAAEPDLPVMLTGYTHDLYGAAGDLLLQRASLEAGAFDVTADGVSLKRSQKQAQLEARAYAYLAKARTRTTNLVRTDETRREDRYPSIVHNPWREDSWPS